MTSGLSLREDYTQIFQRKELPGNDERISRMHLKLSQLTKTRKGEYNVKVLRDFAPKLFNLTFRADADPNALKSKGIWAKKPNNWPKDIFFGDPNNKNPAGYKPKENELRPMFNFLLHSFNVKYPQDSFKCVSCTDDISENTSGYSLFDFSKNDLMLNGNYILSSPRSFSQQSSVNEPNVKNHYNTWDGHYSYGTSSSVNQNSSENFILEDVYKDLNDYCMDENIVISSIPAQSFNPEVNEKYDELINYLSTLTDVLPEQSMFLLTYILNNLVRDDKIDLMLMLGIILKKIKKENGLLPDSYNMIQNNFGDIVKQMYVQPQADEIKKDAKEDELFDSGMDLIELQESDIEEYIDQNNFLSKNSYLLQVEQPVQNEIIHSTQVYPASSVNENVSQLLEPGTINQIDWLGLLNDVPNDAFMNNIGVLPRKIDKMSVHEFGIPKEEMSEQMYSENMDVDNNDHDYGSPQNLATNQMDSNSFGRQIPIVIEEYDHRCNDLVRKKKKVPTATLR